jgi:hypothetical protein
LNFRTYYLPANGVLQVCDNKSHLAAVFEPGKEIVGFDTIDECIDLCRYYLAHDDERRQIAAAGWKRALTDYNEVAVFRHAVSIIEQHLPARASHPVVDYGALTQRRKTRGRRAAYTVAYPLIAVVRFAMRVIRGIVRRLRMTLKQD